MLKFFETSTRNLLAAEAAAGVGHHVALSVVGSDRLPESGYLRAKVAQEKLIRDSPIPYSIIRSTQFFEFVKRIADEATDGKSLHASSAFIQPIASDDVVAALADVAVGAPANGTMEIAGQKHFHLDEDRAPTDASDRRRAGTRVPSYFGAAVGQPNADNNSPNRLGTLHFAEWMAYSLAHAPVPKQGSAAARSAR